MPLIAHKVVTWPFSVHLQWLQSRRRGAWQRS